ncbi:hypothetical protein QE152_g25293 [Popillia japonica]|uniref:Uncharacterized protein n=1 Tax=Popillia japonica TaxID=7064 RepID=A0AAW1K2F0_POPJA
MTIKPDFENDYKLLQDDTRTCSQPFEQIVSNKADLHEEKRTIGRPLISLLNDHILLQMTLRRPSSSFDVETKQKKQKGKIQASDIRKIKETTKIKHGRLSVHLNARKRCIKKMQIKKLKGI